MSRDINPFGLRMPANLRDELETSAAASGRSMNAEIVHRLQQSFEQSQEIEGLRAERRALQKRIGEVESDALEQSSADKKHVFHQIESELDDIRSSLDEMGRQLANAIRNSDVLIKFLISEKTSDKNN